MAIGFTLNERPVAFTLPAETPLFRCSPPAQNEERRR